MEQTWKLEDEIEKISQKENINRFVKQLKPKNKKQYIHNYLEIKIEIISTWWWLQWGRPKNERASVSNFLNLNFFR